MSGRPVNPITWDSGNYPAGSNAWNGTPKRIDPVYRAHTPGTLQAPEYENFFKGNAFDALGGVIKLVGQNPALNWAPVVTSSATKNCNRAAWSQKDQAWFAVGTGSADSAIVSYNFGRTWADVSILSSLTCLDVACDLSGNVVILTTSRSTYVGTRSAYGSVSFAAFGLVLPVAPSGGALAFESTSAQFVACYRNGTSGQAVATSPNGSSAWTARTVPAAWSAYTGTNNPEIAAANGVLIANFYDGTSLRIARSTDGGTTWTEVGVIAPAFAPSLVRRATYDEVNGVWWMMISATSPSRATQIFKSTDGGVTWASVVSLTTSDLFAQAIAALGSLLVMVNDDGRIVWSTDGVSWLLVGKNTQTTAGTAATPLGLRAGGGGLLLLNSPDRTSYVSQRFGDYGQAV